VNIGGCRWPYDGPQTAPRPDHGPETARKRPQIAPACALSARPVGTGICDWKASAGLSVEIASQRRSVADYPHPVAPEYPLLRDVFPDLVAELRGLLEDRGEPDLARSTDDLRLVERCACKDRSCQSIQTVYRPQGGSYGPGHRNLVLRPEKGMLILDVVDGQIMYVEILDRPRMRRRRLRSSKRNPITRKASS
jgi:hypothetical protein